MRQRSRRAWGLDQSHEASAFLAPSRIKFIRPAYWNVKHLELKKSRNSLWCVWTNLWGRADATRADNSINLSRQCCEEKQSTRNSSDDRSWFEKLSPEIDMTLVFRSFKDFRVYWIIVDGLLTEHKLRNVWTFTLPFWKELLQSSVI